MEITYTQKGDCLYPNVTLTADDQLPIGKYGRMRKKYLKEHRPILYNDLIFRGKLQRHLWEIGQTSHQRLGQMIQEMNKRGGISERLKAENPIVWVSHMNALKQQAEETILAELIYT